MRASRGAARPLGVVYTPPAVAAAMARAALTPLLRGQPIEAVLALRICDPAIGEGALLAAAAEVLVEHLVGDGLDEEAARQGAARCLAGVDIDPAAVEVARARLGAGPTQLVIGDALALDLARDFPEVAARGGFDAVLGNPPYVRQEHLAAHKPALRGFASYHGVADLYVYFIELAHRLARAGGRYCLITPNKWLTAAYARALRGHLAAQESLEGVIDLGRSSLFADADAFPCIVWGTVGGARTPEIRAARLPPGAAVELDGVGAPHDRARWRAAPWHIDAPGERSLIDRLEAQWPSLGEVVPAPPVRGVVTGYNRAFVLDEATRDALCEAEPAAAGLIRPFVKGRDVRRWAMAGAERRWILLVDRGTSLDGLPGVRDHLARFRGALEPRPASWGDPWPGRKSGSYQWFELQDPVGPAVKARAPRLLYQDIQSHPVCALDATGELVPDTTVWLLPTDDLFLLAVLNSPLYGWYARRRFPPALNGSVRPKRAYLRRLPIAQPPADLRAELGRLVALRRGLAGATDALATASGGDPRSEGARRNAEALDDAIGALIAEAYELSTPERAQVSAR